MLQEQAVSIAHLLFLGVTLGMLIDIYRVAIALIHPGKYLAAVYDLLFWFIASLWVFLYMLGVTDGEARFYMLVLLATGYILEQWILGKALRASMRSTIIALVRLVNLVIEKLAAILDFLFNMLVAPYRWLYRLAIRPLQLVGLWLSSPIVAASAKIRSAGKRIAQWWQGEE